MPLALRAVVTIALTVALYVSGVTVCAGLVAYPILEIESHDGDGNLATTMPQPPAALGSRLRIRIGLVSAPARVAAGGEWLPDGERVLRPASSGWPLRGGGRRRLVELHLPGGRAAARFDDR
jgi:hypothetical protein